MYSIDPAWQVGITGFYGDNLVEAVCLVVDTPHYQLDVSVRHSDGYQMEYVKFAGDVEALHKSLKSLGENDRLIDLQVFIPPRSFKYPRWTLHPVKAIWVGVDVKGSVVVLHDLESGRRYAEGRDDAESLALTDVRRLFERRLMIGKSS